MLAFGGAWHGLPARAAETPDGSQTIMPPPQKHLTPYEIRNYADPFYQELVTAAKSRKPRDVVAWMNQKIEQSPLRIHPASLWLRDNTTGQTDPAKIDSLYFLEYSDVIYQLAEAYAAAGDHEGATSMTKTALMALYTYEVMASVDAVRCADPTVLPRLRQMMFSRYDRFKEAFKALKTADFDYFADEAFKADRKFEHRVGNDYICSMGDARMNDELRQPGTRTQQIDDPNRPGLTAMEISPPRGYQYQPTYVDDTEWKKHREEVRAEVRRLWKDRYERLTAGPGPLDVLVPDPHAPPDTPEFSGHQ
jgi:hypothetical protein